MVWEIPHDLRTPKCVCPINNDMCGLKPWFHPSIWVGLFLIAVCHDWENVLYNQQKNIFYFSPVSIWFAVPWWIRSYSMLFYVILCYSTVGGRNPAPVDRWFIPLFVGFQPSKVVQDFFHPPYVILCYSHMYLIHQRQSCSVLLPMLHISIWVMKRMVPRGEKTDVLAKNRVITKVNSSC